MDDNNEQRQETSHRIIQRKAAWFQLKWQDLASFLFSMECCNVRILISAGSFVQDEVICTNIDMGYTPVTFGQ